MSWNTPDLNRRVCLTCQYFQCTRRLKAIGSRLVIEYGENRGCCRLHDNTVLNCNSPASSCVFCHYKRWVELPD